MSPLGCAIEVHIRTQYCPLLAPRCRISLDYLTYLPPGQECHSCTLVPGEFATLKDLIHTLELWLVAQPYGVVGCLGDLNPIEIRKPGCMMESDKEFDSCGHILNSNWPEIALDTCASMRAYTRRAIYACNTACCVTLYQRTTTGGVTTITVPSGYPKFTGIECSPRVNTPPYGVDPAAWWQYHIPQYDPSAPCKMVCDCQIPVNSTPPYLYDVNCNPAQTP